MKEKQKISAIENACDEVAPSQEYFPKGKLPDPEKGPCCLNSEDEK